jgi:hypothetical protein
MPPIGIASGRGELGLAGGAVLQVSCGAPELIGRVVVGEEQFKFDRRQMRSGLE